MKKILAITLIAILLCISWASQSYGNDSVGTLEITASKDNLVIGEDFKIGLKTNDIEEIYGMDITISFDPEVIEAKDLEMTLKLIDKNHFVAINKIDDKGNIRLAFTLLGNEKPLDKNIEIGSITFRSIKEKSSNIKIIKSKLLTREGKEIIHSFKECTFSIVDKISSHPQNSSKTYNKAIMKIKDGNNKLEFDGITIFIPEGALDLNSTVAVEVEDMDDKDIVKVYNIILSDNLRNSATLIINVPDIPQNKLQFIYKYNDIDKTWRCLGGQYLDNKISVPLHSSGSFTVCVKDKCHSFNDINGHWAQKWIETLSLMEIINGKSKNFFCPEESITRAEIAKMLDLCLHWSIPSSGKSYEFKDEYIIPKWSKSHVDNLVAKGIICGYNDNTFKPNKKVTREELAVFIDRMLNLSIESEVNIEKFIDDNNISQWCKSSVYRVKSLGIVNGYKDNTFKGKNTVTRAEACKVIVKLLEVMNYL